MSPEIIPQGQPLLFLIVKSSSLRVNVEPFLKEKTSVVGFHLEPLMVPPEVLSMLDGTLSTVSYLSLTAKAYN